MWDSTVLSLTWSIEAIAWFDRPSAMSSSTSLASAERGQPVFGLLSAEQVSDDVGVEDGAARGDTLDGVDEHGDVDDPVFEQVSEARRTVACELGGVATLEGLGQQQDAQIWSTLLEPHRGLASLVGEGRRHSYVHQRHVRLVLRDGPLQLFGVSDELARLHAGFRQDPGEAFSKQDRVIGDHYPHGHLARSRVPPEGRSSTSSHPPAAPARSRMPCKPEPSRRAPPRPSSSTVSSSHPSRAVAPTTMWLPPECFCALAIASHATNDAAGFDIRIEPGVGHVELDRDRRAASEIVERGAYPAVGERRRKEAIREVTELSDRDLELANAIRQSVAEPLVTAVEERGWLVHRQREESLLRTVMKVSFESSPFNRLRGCDASPRLVHLHELRGDRRGVVRCRARTPRRCTWRRRSTVQPSPCRS